jgi:hypothetical protein
MTPGQVHALLMGNEPNEIQQAFYSSGKMGFSDKALDKERFTLVAMLTLQKTMRTSMMTPSRVVLLTPPSHFKWVQDAFDDISVIAFKMLKKYPGSSKGRADLSKMIGNCFKIVFYNSRLLQLPDVPDAWTSFGFTREDPIPDWMRAGLLVSDDGPRPV